MLIKHLSLNDNNNNDNNNNNVIWWILLFQQTLVRKMKENEKIDEYLDLVRELKKLWNIKVMVIPEIARLLGTMTKGLEGKLAKLEIKRKKIKDYTDHIIVEIGWNAQKSSGDWRTFGVT